MQRGKAQNGHPDDQYEIIQAKTFCRWLNTRLEINGLPPMTNLVDDLSDGVRLIQLLEIMAECSLGRYTKKPIMRVQKCENASKALAFIQERGVKLTNIGPEDIVDGNLKLILGMIWTLILRFTIASITEEGLSARDGLLLWCQRKTQGYPGVNVVNFRDSFSDGLALCALIHRHRPDLIDWDALDKTDRHGNTALAFRVAEESLAIPPLLEVRDLCDVETPDERSVMTYVAEFFHKFSSEDKLETVARRVEKFAEVMQSIWQSRNDFERRMTILLADLQSIQSQWSSAPVATAYSEAKQHLADFGQHKKLQKRSWVKEKQELATLYSNIQTKLRTYFLKPWEPRDGLRLQDLDSCWTAFLGAEGQRSRSINASIRSIKEALRKEFARVAEDFVQQLRAIESSIGELTGALEEQKASLLNLQGGLPSLQTVLMTEVAGVNQACLEANVEENDYTVVTLEDLEWELELVAGGLKKKIAFIENSIVSASHTNLTPAKLEEFESVFKHFDSDETNTLTMYEMHAALASLGIVYADQEIEAIFNQLEEDYGQVNFEAWLGLLIEIVEDSSSPDQLRDAFHSIAGEKAYLTELDLEQVRLPKESIRFLTEQMESGQGDDGKTIYDYNAYLDSAFV